MTLMYEMDSFRDRHKYCLPRRGLRHDPCLPGQTVKPVLPANYATHAGSIQRLEQTQTGPKWGPVSPFAPLRPGDQIQTKVLRSRRSNALLCINSSITWSQHSETIRSRQLNVHSRVGLLSIYVMVAHPCLDLPWPGRETCPKPCDEQIRQISNIAVRGSANGLLGRGDCPAHGRH